MESQTKQAGAKDAPSDPISLLIAKAVEYGQNASSNLQDSFTRMTLQHWIRIVVIVGGYILLRPYALKFAAKGFANQLEADEAKEKEKQRERAKISPNELRGVYEVLEEQEEEDAVDTTGADWGQKARVRQRQVLKQLIEAEEKRRLEEEEDKDIEEFLTD